MLKMVDGTGIIGVDMICPLGVSTPQPPNYDSVEMEGTGMLVLPNSLDAPLERLELGGKTEQVQTSGKQMLNEELLKSLSNYTSNESDYYYHRISGLEVGKKYTISRGYVKTGKNALLGISVNQESTNKAKFLVYDGLGTGYNNASITWEQTTGEYVDILFSVSGSVTSTTQERLSEFWGRISYVQLEKGTTATPYEPYTGGKPSPSPEYPQEIKNSGKWNEEKQKYDVDVKVTGKNLFDIEKASEKANWTQHNNFPGYYNFPVFVGKDNTITMSIPQKIPTGQGLFLSVCLSESGGRDGWIAHSSNASLNNAKLTYKATTDYIYINAHSDTIAGMERFFGELQIECGNVATPYQPYKEQSLTLTSDRPITKWDRLVEQGGEIGWLYGSVIATIDETASISLYVPNGFYVYVKNIDKKEKTGYCDKLYAKRMSNGEPFVLFGNANNNVLYTLNTQEFYGKTASEIKAKLKEYPLNIIGKSETTEFIPLPQSEQNAIRALKTYYPTTVITVDGGELDPDIKVTYRKEI